MLQFLAILSVVLSVVQPLWVQPVLRVEPIETPAGFEVRFHPAGELYVGDQISIEVFVPDSAVKAESHLKAEAATGNGVDLGSANPAAIGDGRQRFTYLWAWNTDGLAPGDYPLRFTLTPGDTAWVETVHLLPAPPGPTATWQLRVTECCNLHYFSGTAAERDIDQLAQTIDARAHLARQALRMDDENSKSPQVAGRQKEKIEINLVPRLLGQGGFAAEEITVTYADDNPANTDAGMVIQHELTHILDGQMGGDERPLIFVEGIAVYLTGGHYHPEPVLLRAAGLLSQGGWMPLALLSEDFYSHQHENGYLEAAALVGYMVKTWGWEAFNNFYRDIHQARGQSTASAIDDALKRHFQLSLAALNDRLAAWLAALPVLPDLGQDVQLTAAYFDEIRNYQGLLDPSADFRQVWLPDPKEMRKRGIVGDYLRSPGSPIQERLTGLLRQTGQDLRLGRYSEAWAGLASVQIGLAGVKK
jgi:hypothetical protein